MPRWKALPEELDPQVREFASQLRRLVDRSGLSIAAVADRTGYSKTSWERYLNGRLLAPKGAVVALAEVTGTNSGHLTTMWELAERAWSRSEMRHDMTMEAIRISQARAALGEFGQSPAPVKGGRTARRTATDSAPGPAAAGVGTGASSFGSAGLGSVGTGTGGRVPVTAPPGSGVPPQSPPGGFGGGSGSPDGRRRRRKVTMFLAGVVGALLVIAAAALLTDLGGKDKDPVANTKPTPSPTTSAPELPLGVKCSGDDCTGEDPENMGCGGEFARTASSVTVGTALVEVRYSKTCGAAWARITQATPGDKVQVTSASEAGEKGQNGTVDADKDAYTPMVAVTKAADAKACATLTTGVKGCTTTQE
ncbi:XRE family transcriptional regulator [Streptomyces spiramyceticus]|uniref:XRE family transcriptional regulator n=1 Tax=Streptomyces spiramyceticus TaxID=299717 RepID=UPI00237C1E96|nr:XRE family transcriptional regulator [Streptomyces spiramyceticus]